ncbi:aminopeptidase N [Corynebacterium sp.]|uniref:aminopeptidase N n=1 Tax=Corynebacterium sp. TaxID=1720 RepID=UPI0028B175F2|nr:aminopeptidase N [Corynebacterium sp.]
MTSINLTHDEAQHRSTLINVSHYDVELDLREDKQFTSHTTVKFKTTATGSTFIDLRADEITEARLNGVPVPLDAYNPTYGIALSGLEVAEYELKVTAKISYSRTGEGLHRFVDPVDNNVYLYTQFETADAKRVFACFDQPDMKATYSLTFHTPSEWKVITNSPVTREGDTWSATVETPLSTYLIALCAGPYYEVTDTWTGELAAHPEGQPAAQLEVPLGLYCRASLAEHMDSVRLFTETKQGFDFYHANFGFAYPFGKYDQILVPEFNAGAMENAGCVTIRDEYVFSSQATHYMYERRADTILHELAHMWFGDLVTMKWWDDLWLNESFATWAAAISQAENTEYDTAWVTFANVEKSWAYQQDQLPTTHPISTDASDIETVEQNFDGITYAKGASVLKQLQAYVGRENFFAGVRRHFSKHAWGNATFNDLLGHLEDASGRDLSFWAAEWLKTTGVNTLSAETEQEGGKYTSFAVQQSGDTLRTHRIAVGLYRLEDGQVSRFKQVEVDISGERTEVPELAGAEVAELVLLNDDDLTYTLLEFDPETVEFVVNNIDKIADPMARTLCWSTAWEMTRAGTMRARDFAQLVARGLSAETELAVLERICNQAITAVDTYADPQWAKAEGFALLADAFLTEAQAEGADSARTIVFKQALTKIDLNDAARDYLVELRASSDDKALRWKALAALVANGAIDDVEAVVAKELEADNTASGYQASLRALAAFNSDENKRAVWDEIMSLQLSNLELRHKLEGLTMSGSEKHLVFAPDEYFANAQKVWDAGSSEIALGTIQGLYPSWIVSQDTIDATDKFLTNELPGGLRRAVTEERDRLARALRNRAIDAE